MYDNEGQLLSSYELLGKLAGKWDILDTNTKNYIASTIAGTNQLNNFLALMNNFDHAVEATNTALNSSGSAVQENSRYMESLNAKTQAVKATFQDLANNVINSQLVKSILDLTNAFLELLNTPVGNFATQVVLLTGAMGGFSALITAGGFVKKIGVQFVTAFQLLTGAIESTTVATTALGVASKIAFPILGLVAAAISAIIAVAPYVSDWYKEITNDVEYANEQLEENNNQLKTNQERLEELYNVPFKNRTSDIQLEIDKLEEENRLLQDNIDKWTEKSNLGSLEDLLEENKFENQATGYFQVIGEGATELNLFVQNAQDAIYWLKEYGLIAKDATGSLEDFGFRLEESYRVVEVGSEQYYTDLIKRQQELNEAFENGEEITIDMIEAYDSNGKAIDELTSAMSKVPDSELDQWLIDFRNEAENLPDVFTDMVDTYYGPNGVNDTITDLAAGLSVNEYQITQLLDKYPQLTDAIKQNASGYYIESDALNVLSNAGALQVSTLQLTEGQVKNLIQLYPQLANLIQQNANGYYIEISSIKELANSQEEWVKDFELTENDMTLILKREIAKRLALRIKEAQALGSEYDAKDFENLVNAYRKLGEEIRYEMYWGSKETEEEVDEIVTSTGSAVSSASTKVVDAIKEQSDAFKELNEITEHQIYLREQQGASEQDLIALYKDYRKEIESQADWFREHGVSEDSEYIRDLQKQWWDITNTIKDLENQITENAREEFDKRLKISEDYIDERNDLSDWGADNEIYAWNRVLKWMDEWYDQGLIDYEYYLEKRKEVTLKEAKAEQEAWENNLEKEIDSLSEKQKAYETLFSLISDKAQEEIDALEEQKTAVEEYWQSKIDVLEQANQELDDQIEKEEALDALARARQTEIMVYKDGRFQYISDVDQVSEAQANLEKIEREEKLKSEIEQLEKSRDEALSVLEDKIEDWEEFVRNWESILDEYEREQNLAFIQEQLNISEQEVLNNLEAELWEERLKNFSSYIEQYKNLVEELNKAQQNLEEGYQSSGDYTNNGGGVAPGTGSLAGTQYNAWAWVPGSGYVPVTVEGGKTQQTGLPEGTIIYGDDKAWIITGGSGGEEGYTSEEYGPTPDSIWTPSKGGSTGSGGGSGSVSTGGGSSSSSNGPYYGTSSSGGSYVIGSDKGQNFVDNAPVGSTMTGGDGSSWTKNPDGSTTINRGDDTWVVPANANGTLSSVGGLSLVGENGPELRILNSGDGIIPSDVTKNLWKWGSFEPKDLLNNAQKIISITIDNFAPNLSNVSDGESFANYMKTNFWRQVVQYQGT